MSSETGPLNNDTEEKCGGKSRTKQKKTEKSGQSTNTSREGSANAEHQTELNKYFSIYIRDSDMEGRDT